MWRRVKELKTHRIIMETYLKVEMENRENIPG